MSALDIVSEAARHHYELSSDMVCRLVNALVQSPTEMNMDAFREWWTRSSDVTLAYVMFCTIVKHSPVLTTALCGRIMTDVPIMPLADHQHHGRIPAKLGDGAHVLEPADRDSLWAHVCLHSVSTVIGEQHQYREQLRIRLLSRAEVLSEVISMRNLMAEVQEYVSAGKSVKEWIDKPEQSEFKTSVARLVVHFWSSMCENLDCLGQYPVDIFLQLLTLNPYLPDKTPLPYAALMRILGGGTVIQSKELRAKCLNSMAHQLIPDACRFDVAQHPDFVTNVCMAMVTLPKNHIGDTTWLIAAITVMDRALVLDFHSKIPYLYEQASLEILNCNLPDQIGDENTRAALKVHQLEQVLSLLSRVQQQWTHHATIEGVFWAITNTLNRIVGTLEHEEIMERLPRPLCAFVTMPSNWTLVQRLWGMCTQEDMLGWSVMFGSHSHLVAPDDNTTPTCAISDCRVPRTFKFSAEDTAAVGLETMLTQFATKGMINPFTNLEVTWESIHAANPNWQELSFFLGVDAP